MITEQKRFVITSDTLPIPTTLEQHEEYAEAERAQQIVTLAEFIYSELCEDIPSYECIDLARAILIKFDKI